MCSMCRVCSLGNWNKKLATGRVVLCFYTPGLVYEIAQEAVKTAKGLGLIFAEPFTKPIADVDYDIPTLHVDINQGTIIRTYLAESGKYANLSQPKNRNYAHLLFSFLNIYIQ